MSNVNEGILNFEGKNPMVAYDPAARVFGLSTSSRSLRLYSMAQPGTAPFATFEIADGGNSEWTSMSFSNDGKNILISTKGDAHYIVDAFDGSIKHALRGHSNPMGLPLECNFTPDANYVLGGITMIIRVF